MSVFDDIALNDAEPPLPGEAQYAYLNRSARLEAARVREKVDAWFSGYPESHRDGLAARFRSCRAYPEPVEQMRRRQRLSSAFHRSHAHLSTKGRDPDFALVE